MAFGPPWIPAVLLPGNPPLGTNYTGVVPASEFWHLLGFKATFVAGANVGNRVLLLAVNNQLGAQSVFTASGSVQTASQTITYSGFNGANNFLNATAQVATFSTPDIVMPEAYSFSLTVAGVFPADAIINIAIVYEYRRYD